MEFALPRFPPLVKERRQTIPENNGALARKRDRRKSRVQGIGIVLRRSLQPWVDFLPAQYSTGVNDFGSIDRRGGLWHELRESPTRADPDRTIRLGGRTRLDRNRPKPARRGDHSGSRTFRSRYRRPIRSGPKPALRIPAEEIDGRRLSPALLTGRTTSGFPLDTLI